MLENLRQPVNLESAEYKQMPGHKREVDEMKYNEAIFVGQEENATNHESLCAVELG